MIILAIDPGDKDSGYCYWDRDNEIAHDHGKVSNEKLLDMLKTCSDTVGIERVRSYGQQVGNETLDTCEVIGAFENEAKRHAGVQVFKIPRPDILKHFGIEKKGSDKWLKEWLYDHYPKVFPGAKRNKTGSLTLPGWSDHDLAALAVAVYCGERL